MGGRGLAPSGQLDHLPATAYRFGHPQPDAGRLVIELASPASPERAFTLPPNRTGHRLVIDLMDRGEISFSLAQKALASGSFQPAAQTAAQNTLPPPTSASNLQSGAPAQASLSGRPVTIGVPQPRPKRWVVAIDAGHGGKRPGRDWQARQPGKGYHAGSGKTAGQTSERFWQDNGTAGAFGRSIFEIAPANSNCP